MYDSRPKTLTDKICIHKMPKPLNIVFQYSISVLLSLWLLPIPYYLRWSQPHLVLQHSVSIPPLPRGDEKCFCLFCQIVTDREFCLTKYYFTYCLSHWVWHRTQNYLPSKMGIGRGFNLKWLRRWTWTRERAVPGSIPDAADISKKALGKLWTHIASVHQAVIGTC